MLREVRTIDSYWTDYTSIKFQVYRKSIVDQDVADTLYLESHV